MSEKLTEFLVKDVPEEYFIIDRMCCPKCRAPKLERVRQELLQLKDIPQVLKHEGASGKADKLILKCKECGFQFTILFHLHRLYVERLRSYTEKILKILEE